MFWHQKRATRTERWLSWPTWLASAMLIHGFIGLAVTVRRTSQPPQTNPALPDEPMWEGALTVWLDAELAPSGVQSLPLDTRSALATLTPTVASQRSGAMPRSPQARSETHVTTSGEFVPLASAEPLSQSAPAPQAQAADPIQDGTQSPPHAPSNLAAFGLSAPGVSANYHVVSPMLERRDTNPLVAAEARLNASLDQGLLERDRLAMTSIEATAKRTLAQALLSTSFQSPSPLTLRFVATPHGKLERVEVLSGGGAPADAIARLVNALANQPFSGQTPRPVQFTFQVLQRVALASGRTAGTGLSIGPVDAVRQGAKDSPKVAILPRKNRLVAPQKLARDRRETERDPTRPILFEQTVLDLDSDLVDFFTTGEHVNQINVLKREVL